MATTLAFALAVSVPGVAASIRSDRSVALVADEITWLPIRTAEGVYGEGHDVTRSVRNAAEAGDAYSFDRLDADGEGTVQEAEWAAAATGSGMGERLAREHFSVIDEDGNGLLAEEEFQAMTSHHYVQALSRTEVGDGIPDVVHMPVVIYRLQAS